LNAQQIELFDRLRARLQAAPTVSELRGDAHGQRVLWRHRASGHALYGGNPSSTASIRCASRAPYGARAPGARAAARAIWAGATCTLPAGTRLATVSVGYADGYLRSLGNCGVAAVAGVRVPVVGRVSMDLITLDVTALPSSAVQSGTPVELVRARCPSTSSRRGRNDQLRDPEQPRRETPARLRRRAIRREQARRRRLKLPARRSADHNPPFGQ
jgi:alanine racemase